MQTAARSRGGGAELVTKSTDSDFHTLSRRPLQAPPDVPPNWRSIGSVANDIVGQLRYSNRRVTSWSGAIR